MTAPPAAQPAEHICTRFVNDEHGMVRCHECHSPAVLPRAAQPAEPPATDADDVPPGYWDRLNRVLAPAEPPAPDDLVQRLRDVLRNWTNVTDDEQSVIREAADLIEQQAREIARLTKARGEWIGRQRSTDNLRVQMIERAERAEAECADLRRRLAEHIDDKERALRLAAKESNRLTTECAKLRAEFRNLAAILRVNILRLESKATSSRRGLNCPSRTASFTSTARTRLSKGWRLT